MRYAEGPETHAEMHTDAPPESVWPLVADIRVPDRFSPELQRVEWLDGATEPAVGASFAGYNSNEMLPKWRTVSHIVACEPPRVFAYAVLDADGRFGDPEPPSVERPMALWRFDLQPADGGTLLQQTVRLGPARSGVSLAIERGADVVAYRLRMLRDGMLATLQGIKSLAESGR